MALNMDAIGKKIGPMTKTYDWKDAALYALGVGAGFSQLNYCYERDQKVLPSFSIAAIIDMLNTMGNVSNINLAGVLHGEQDLIFHDLIPPSGTLTTEGKLTHYYDKGQKKGALVIGETETFHSNGRKLFTGRTTLFSRLDGGFGGEPAPRTTLTFPERSPDICVKEHPATNQPLIYRLTGDLFPLHVDPDFAKSAGFEKPIMHGLCTHGYACRALINSLIPGKPEEARRMFCRFSRPLYPGVPIEIRIWKMSATEAYFRVVNLESQEIVLDNGIFEYGPAPLNTIRFDDQVAIITGAGGGLGRVYALELAKRGAKVVVNDFGGGKDGQGQGSKGPADLVVDEIKRLGGQAVANTANVATPEGGASIVQTALDAFGTVDILINNAGILRDKSFLKMTTEAWQAVMDVHLNGAFYVTLPAFKVMKAQGYGRIILTTSAAGLYGNFGQTNYSAAKMALVGFANALKEEGEKYNIKTNTIAPIAASRLTEDVLPPDLFDRMKPEYIAPMVLFLSSSDCTVNGQIYNAGLGNFNRVALVTGPGQLFPVKDHRPTPEALHARMDSISALSPARFYRNINEQAMDILAAPSTAADKPQIETDGKGSKGFETPQDVFDKLPDAFNAQAAKGVTAVFQYSIAGDDGGDWFCAIQEGVLTISTGIHETPTCTLRMTATDFLAIMNGSLKAMQAFSTGKLKITGDVMKSGLIEKIFKL